MNTRLRESRWRAALVGHETAGCDDSLARPTTTTTTQVRTMPPNPRVTRCIPRAQAPRTTSRRARPTVSPPAPPVCRCPAPLRGFRPTTSPRQRQAAARYAHARHPPAGASTRAARTGRAEARVVCVCLLRHAVMAEAGRRVPSSRIGQSTCWGPGLRPGTVYLLAHPGGLLYVDVALSSAASDDVTTVEVHACV